MANGFFIAYGSYSADASISNNKHMQRGNNTGFNAKVY